MKALMLAAGVGNRLGSFNNNKPKSLLEFENKSLLQRHLENLQKYGVKKLVIVVGYQAELIEAEIDRLQAQAWVETIYNPNYTQGSVVSFAALKACLNNEDQDVLVMDADVLYDDQILARLINTNRANCFLLDRNFEMGEEPVKLCVKNNIVIEFRKQLPTNLSFDIMGESVGFFRFSVTMIKRLIEQAELDINSGRIDEPYEDVIRDLLLANPTDFSYEDITGIPWIEIDFPEDIQRAKTKVLSQIN
jgi:choline kinase